MHGILWSFFKDLREKSNLVLSIDQYEDLLVALHAMPAKVLENPMELREFCKLFWLFDKDEEATFDQLFSRYFAWEEFKQKMQLADNELVSPTVVDSPNISTGSNTGESRAHISTDDEPISNINPTNEDEATVMEDFELVIDEGGSGQTETVGNVDIFSHEFSLTDASIMPFPLRNIAQRLRRKIESPTRELTDQINMPAMIRQLCHHRYVEEIIYQFKDSSESNVVLLADRFGSMLAYEFWEEHLKTTFQAIPSCRFEHYFFYNLPPKSTKHERHFTLKNSQNANRNLETKKHHWTDKTWFFIFSDAGAHSGMVNKGRMMESLKMWRYFSAISSHVHWLNPVPTAYMNDCSAKRLQFAIPMVYPDEQGLKKIIYPAKKVAAK